MTAPQQPPGPEPLVREWPDAQAWFGADRLVDAASHFAGFVDALAASRGAAIDVAEQEVLALAFTAGYCAGHRCAVDEASRIVARLSEKLGRCRIPRGGAGPPAV